MNRARDSYQSIYRSVLVDGKKAVKSGGDNLDGVYGGSGEMEDVGKGVEDASRGHENLVAGDGDVEECGASVFLGSGTGGVEGFGEARASAIIKAVVEVVL